MNVDSINNRLNYINKIRQIILKEIELEKEAIQTINNSGIHNLVLLKENNELSKLDIAHSAKLVNNFDEKEMYIRKLEEFSDKEFFSRVKPIIDKIPESNGCKYYSRLNINIGIIADQFLYNSFKDVANFIYITKENYKEYIGKLDVFLIVSTWGGLNEEWRGIANKNNKNLREELFKITQKFKESGAKIVFYSKEDPVNYDKFIDIAKKCDYIFTTAQEVIEDYKVDCNNERVYVLEFGINPCYHNPIGFKKFPKFREVLFSGSWYNFYPERIEDTKLIFDGVLKSDYGLRIIDRNYHLQNSDFFFPEQYINCISPSIEHEYLQKLHKLYNWAININTVKYSNTMFANRVYELQALGNILFSNYNTAIKEKFPNVYIIQKENEVKDIIGSLTDEEIYKKQIYGIRRVMSHETTYHRIEQLLNHLGLKYVKQNRKVGIVVKEKTDRIIELFNKQTYIKKELILEDTFNNNVLEQYDIITFFDERKDYGEYYLEDMINAFKYTNSEYITKDAYYEGEEFISGIEHDYVNIMKDKYRTVFWSEKFKAEELLEYNEPVIINGGYSIDRFEFNNKGIVLSS